MAKEAKIKRLGSTCDLPESRREFYCDMAENAVKV